MPQPLGLSRYKVFVVVIVIYCSYRFCFVVLSLAFFVVLGVVGFKVGCTTTMLLLVVLLLQLCSSTRGIDISLESKANIDAFGHKATIHLSCRDIV